MPKEPFITAVAVTLLAAALFLPWLGARDLWNPNEPTYGRAVVEMAERGDLLIPTVNGVVFDEKPILYFWLALGLSVATTGIDEATLRLPSALAGVAWVGMLFLLVRPYTGTRRAGYAAAIGATLYVVWWSARSIQMDLLLSACTLAVVLCVSRVVDHGFPPRIGWIAAGGACGLGLLAKGPVGFVCPALAVVPYLISTGRVGRLFGSGPVLAGVAALAVAAPWYGMLWWRGEAAFLSEVLVRQNFLRFVEPWDHQAPWWYYLYYLWLDWLPWSVFLPLAIGAAPRDGTRGRVERLAWVWLVATLVFFSLSASKRSPYILPAAPALAILVSGVLVRLREGRLSPARARLCRGLFLGWGLLLVASGAFLAASAGRLTDGDAGMLSASRPVVVVAIAGGLAVLAAALARRHLATLGPASLLGATVSLYLVGAAVALPAANAAKSHRRFCATIEREVPATAPIVVFGPWKWRASYSYYSGRSIPNILTLDELREHWSRPQRVFAVVEHGQLEQARRVIGEAPPQAEGRFGHNAAYLFVKPADAARRAQTARSQQ